MKWPARRLDEIGHVSRGRSRHRPRDAAHLYGGPYPFIQTGDVKHADLYVTSYSQTYSEAGLAQSRLWPVGTLCITIAANIADTAILGIDACFPDSIIGFTPDPKKADARFIKYSFDALLQRQYQNFSKGAAQDNLSQEKLLSVTFLAPAVEIQVRIADMISAYDSLIENNRRRIRLLDGAARFLYQEWFVRLRFPGHEHTQILNGAPVGWQIKTLGDVLTLKRGYDLPGNERLKGEVPVVSSSGVTGYHNEIRVRAPGVVTGRYGALGEVFFVQKDFWPLNTALYISDFKDSPPEYAAHLLRNLLAGVQSDKAAVPGLNRNVLHKMAVPVPPKSLREQFSVFASLAYRQTLTLENSCVKLKAARDLLLPRLMSGEVEV
jgi:type I restriction enzyme S subunit